MSMLSVQGTLSNIVCPFLHSQNAPRACRWVLSISYAAPPHGIVYRGHSEASNPNLDRPKLFKVDIKMSPSFLSIHSRIGVAFSFSFQFLAALSLRSSLQP